MAHSVVSTHSLPYDGEARRTVRGLIWTGLWSRVVEAANTAAAAYDKRRSARQGIAELHDLSDRMLADIGVPRHGIERVVREARDRVDARRSLETA